MTDREDAWGFEEDHFGHRGLVVDLMDAPEVADSDFLRIDAWNDPSAPEECDPDEDGDVLLACRLVREQWGSKLPDALVRVEIALDASRVSAVRILRKILKDVERGDFSDWGPNYKPTHRSWAQQVAHPGCRTCAHPRADAIDSKLRGGQSGRSVAREFGLTEASVRRHKGHLMPGIEHQVSGDGRRGGADQALGSSSKIAGNTWTRTKKTAVGARSGNGADP